MIQTSMPLDQGNGEDRPNLAASYLDLIEGYRHSDRSFIKTISAGTGLGKTFGAFEAAGQAFRQAIDRGESLVFLYTSPQKKHLDRKSVLDVPSMEALKEQGFHVPVVQEYADGDFQSLDGEQSLFRWMETFDQRQSGKKRLLNLLQSLLPDDIADQADEDEDQVERSAVIRRLYNDVRKQKVYYDLMDKGAEKTAFYDEEIAPRMATLVRRFRDFISTAMRHLEQNPAHLDEKLGDRAWLYRRIRDWLFPWYRIQQGVNGQAMGLLISTSQKMLTKKHVFALRKNLAAGVPWKRSPRDLEHVIHGNGDLWRMNDTRFILLIDEADAAHSSIQSDDNLTGILLDGGYPVQGAGAFFREVGRVFTKKPDEVRAIRDLAMAVIENPNEPSLRAQINEKTRSIATPEVIREMASLYEMREWFRSMAPSLQAGQQRSNDGDGRMRSRYLTNRMAGSAMYMAAHRDDPLFDSLGSGGLFTASPTAFVNGHRLDRFRFDLRMTDQALMVSEPHLNAPGIWPAGMVENKTPLEIHHAIDVFDLLLETIFLFGVIAPAGEDYRMLRAIFQQASRAGTHAAPTSRIMGRLSRGANRAMMESRHVFEPDASIDFETAFRQPHLVLTFDCMPEGESPYQTAPGYRHIVPKLRYRRMAAEHWLERVLVGQHRGDSEETAERTFRGHGAFLISATGGFRKTRLGGFSPAYLAQSGLTDFHPMTERDTDRSRACQESREKRRGGRPTVRHFDEGLIPTHAVEFLRFALQDADVGKACANQYKKHELARALSVIELMSGIHEPGEVSEPVSHEAHAALSQSRSAMVFLQTAAHLVKALNHLSATQKDFFISLKEGALYLFNGFHGPDGRRTVPTFVLVYDAQTEGRLASLAESIDLKKPMPLHQKVAEIVGRISIESLKGRLGSVAGVMQSDTRARVLVVSPYLAASRGVNLVMDSGTINKRPKRDIDTIVLAMSSFYSQAKPRRLPARIEKDGLKEPREKPEAAKSTLIRSMQVVGWVATDHNTDGLARNKDLCLHPEDRFDGAREMLNEQHAMLLAMEVMQALGRTERTDARQTQHIFLQNEVMLDLARAYPHFYWESAGGQPDLLDAASLNSKRALNYAIENAHSAFSLWGKTRSEDPVKYAKKYQSKARRAYQAKRDLLAAIQRLRDGQIKDGDEAHAIMRQWEAFRSPDWLFDMDEHRDKMEAAGVDRDLMDSLWFSAPTHQLVGSRFGVKKGAFQGERLWYLYLSQDEIDSAIEENDFPAVYDPVAIVKSWRLPFEYLETMDVPPNPVASLVSISGDTTWFPRPHLIQDRNGVWGEFAARAWIRFHFDDDPAFASVSEAPMSDFPDIFEMFDLLYEVERPDGSRALLFVDAKHFGHQSDIDLHEGIRDRIPDKAGLARQMADEQGMPAICLYLNTHPIMPGSEQEPETGEEGVLALSAFRYRLSDDPFAPTEDEVEQANSKTVFTADIASNGMSAQILREALQ